MAEEKAPESAPKETGKYLPHLDGWRGTGIILVVFYHMGFTLCRHGWLCISLFFSLSGLLITGITVNQFEKSGSIAVVRFWSRRVGRLLPALLLVIVMVSLFQGLDSEDLFYLRGDLIWGIFYFENVHLINKKEDYFAGFQKPSLMRHVWTLAVEEQYYLFWPIIFWLWTQLGMRGICSGTKAGPEGASQREMLSKTENGDTEAAEEEDESSGTSPALRTTLKALCFGELLVMSLSYWATHITITEMGMSAAYFSTWSRCGDFAAGGLVYLLVHLNPALKKRYLRQHPLEPMSDRFRIGCEMFHTLGYIAILCVPMMQKPLAEVLPFYFYVWRLPFSLFIISCPVAGAMVSSEPMPKWAIVTRFLSSKPMAMLGIISYGVYLVHWPFILWLGTPMNHDAFEAHEAGLPPIDGSDEDMDPILELLRDYGIAAFSLAFGLLMFFAYEKPLMIRAGKVKRPWKVLACGLLASLVVTGIVLLCTQGAQDPNTRDDEWALDNDLAVEKPVKTHVPFIGDISGISTKDSKYPPLTLWEPPDEAVSDSRKTPMIFLTPTYSGMSLADILDHNTSPAKLSGGILHNHNQGDGYPPDIEGSQITSEVLEKGRQQGGNVIFACRSLYISNTDGMDAIKEAHPCNAKYQWQDDTTWVWVRSNLLCGVAGNHRPGISANAKPKEIVELDESMHSHFFESTKCPHRIPEMVFLDIPDWLYWESDEEHVSGQYVTAENTYSGRQDRDAYLLLEMLLAGAVLAPNAINKESLVQFHAKHEAEKGPLEHLAAFWDDSGIYHSYQEAGGGVVTLEVMGDSVAHKIGILMKELLSSCVIGEEDKESKADSQGPVFPQLIISNRGMGGEACIQHFIPCVSDCQGAARTTQDCQGQLFDCEHKPSDKSKKTEAYERTRSAIEIVQPEFLILQDAHWLENEEVRNTQDLAKETWYLALEKFLANAQDFGVQHVFLMTNSPLHPSYESPGNKDIAYREIAERNRCKGGQRGMMLSMFEWHKLICPKYEEVTKCTNRDKHGFEFILVDLLHPKGDSGNWLVAQAFSAILRRIAQTTFGFSPDAAYEIPLVECLVDNYPTDHEPELDDILVDLGTVCM